MKQWKVTISKLAFKSAWNGHGAVQQFWEIRNSPAPGLWSDFQGKGAGWIVDLREADSGSEARNHVS
jgi:hypothetical protein